MLFQPFERLGKENSGISGAGIGLVITKRLVELMNGTIEYKSSIGEGSTFYIKLPVCDAPTTSLWEPEIKEICAKKQGKEQTILYIEDNDENLNLMKKIFLRRPFLKLIYAAEAKTGIDLARSQHPDLILMDINLPGMDGITAMRQLKSAMETRNIPVVALSANALKTQINNAMKEGFIHYITKPIKITEFLNTLDRLLEP